MGKVNQILTMQNSKRNMTETSYLDMKQIVISHFAIQCSACGQNSLLGDLKSSLFISSQDGEEKRRAVVRRIPVCHH